MDNINQENLSPLAVFIQFIGILFRMFGIYFVGFAIVALVFKFGIGIDLQNVTTILEKDIPLAEKQNFLLLVQTIAPLVQFILLPFIYIFFYQKILINDVVSLNTWKAATFFALAVMLYFTFLPVLEFLIKWNQSWVLPDSWSAIEKSLYDMEEKAREITELIIKYDTKTGFIKVLFVVAILPAIGEELFFRGLLQNEIKYLTGNIHVAVWFSAIAFSFVHFQFFGFVPRMCLGLLFGYLYVWSGNILIPMGLHFLNNGATLILMNAYRDKYEEMEKGTLEDMSIFPVLIFTVLTGVIIYYLNKMYKERKIADAE